MITFTKKVTRIGGSLGFTIPKDIVENRKMKKGMLVRITMCEVE